MTNLTEYITGLNVKKLRELRKMVSQELRRKEGKAFGDMLKRRRNETKREEGIVAREERE